MARIVAVDWDLSEVRCAVGTTTAGRLRVRALAAAPMVMVAKEGHEPHPDPGETLRQLLAEQGAARAVVLVGVDRGDVELLDLSLPPAKDSELPELVLMQVMRDMPAVTEESAIDFVTQDADPTQPRRVQAMLLPADRMDHVRQVCTAAGVKPRRILLRSFALASLFAHAAGAHERCVMLVDRVGDEVELAVLVEGRLTLQRTFRLPAAGDAEKTAGRLLAEVKRTAAVAVADQAAVSVECVYVVGRPAEQDPLAAAVRAQTGLEVKVFDPVAAVDVEERLLGEHSERFAPLLGMLLDEARGTRHAVDFANPRRVARRSNRKRTLLLAGFAAFVAVMLGLDSIWNTLADADAQNQKLEKELAQLKKVVKEANDRSKIADGVSDWLAGDVNWLDELRDLSIRFPTARDMIVLRVNMASTPRAGGGELAMQGVVRDPQVVAHMETTVRDKYHELSSKRVQERVREKTYSWHFETQIAVSRRTKSQYTSHLPRSADSKEKEPPAVTPSQPKTP